MSIATPPRIEADQRFLLDGVSWEFYERLLAELRDRPIRVTYDRGRLELMAPTYRHGRYGRVLGRFIEIAADEADLPCLCAGITTFRREDLERGLEPDDCFYFANLARILGKKELDLSVDPPPDLAIEVDVTRSSIDRLSIYAALGVAEVWRYDGRALMVHRLADDGTYQIAHASGIFPWLELGKLKEFLQESFAIDDTRLNRKFRTWVRRRLKPPKRGR